MYELLYFRYFALEETERVGIGHHHGSYGVIEQSAQVFRVDDSVSCRFYLNNFQSAYSSRSRVCAVCRVGHNHLCTLHVATALMVGAYNHESGKLAMSTCKGIEGELFEPGYCRQALLHLVVQLQCSLACLLWLQGMQFGKLGHGSHFFVDDRIVLHRATSQRIESVVYAEVVGAQISVVAYNGKLVALRLLGVIVASHGFWQFMMSKLVFGEGITASPWMRQFKNQISIKTVVHSVSSFTMFTSWSISCFVRFSVTANIRVLSSIFMPPNIPFSINRFCRLSTLPL